MITKCKCNSYKNIPFSFLHFFKKKFNLSNYEEKHIVICLNLTPNAAMKIILMSLKFNWKIKIHISITSRQQMKWKSICFVYGFMFISFLSISTCQKKKRKKFHKKIYLKLKHDQKIYFYTLHKINVSKFFVLFLISLRALFCAYTFRELNCAKKCDEVQIDRFWLHAYFYFIV